MRSMKTQLLLVFIILLASCTQFGAKESKGKDRTRSWPKEERQLLNEFNKWLYKYSSQNNDISKTEILEAAIPAVNDYSRNKMPKTFAKWVVQVGGTDILGSDDKVVETKFLVIRHDDPNDKYPEFSNIVLTTTVPIRDKNATAMLKPLWKGEKVLLSGEFIALEEGDQIYSNGYSTEPYKILTNPKFNIKLKKIDRYLSE